MRRMIDVQLRPGEIKRDTKSGVKIWKEINWELTKGKAGTHEGKVGAYRYYFDPPEVDFCSDMVNFCKQQGIVRFAGRKWVIEPVDGILDEQMTFGSAEALLRAAEEMHDLQRLLWALMLRSAKLDHVRYK